VIIVDNALKAREAQGKPIRVGMIGAGFMGRGLVNQIVHSVPGERMVAIFNRQIQKAIGAYQYAGLEPVVATTQHQLDDAIRSGKPVVSEDPFLLCRSEQIDCLVDVTGAVEFGARVVLDAFKHGKPVVLMNAELDATIGPILQVYAREYKVILSACDGDQPGVEINLWRYVKGLGLIPRVMGNIKGLQDRYRNPTTQKGFAERWGQNPSMVTSFADGSKVSFEQAIVANACGLQVKSRGMSRGYEHHEHVDTLTKHYDIEELRTLGGIVDYVVGAQPNPGIYCIAEHTDPKQRHYLNLYKLGEGPLYSFYTPWHLCHFEVANTVARVVLLRRRRHPAGRSSRRGLRLRQDRPQGRGGPRRIWTLHDLRRGGELIGDAARGVPARGAGRRLQAQARHRQGRGDHLRRRRTAPRPTGRCPARRAVRPFPGGGMTAPVSRALSR
jgi:predicted homoserine dehydrogenase-like protein